MPKEMTTGEAISYLMRAGVGMTKQPDEWRWISLEDALPKKGDFVITIGVVNGEYIGSDIGVALSDIKKIDNKKGYTHWLKLPPPPMEEL